MTTPKLNAAWLQAKQRALEAYNAKDALGMVQAEVEADILARKRDLVEQAARLADRLTTMAARVEAEPENHHSMNSLGEVQSSGADLDRLCVEIGVFREVLAGINSARKAAERAADGSAS